MTVLVGVGVFAATYAFWLEMVAGAFCDVFLIDISALETYRWS
jgi:hypothetical protein